MDMQPTVLLKDNVHMYSSKSHEPGDIHCRSESHGMEMEVGRYARIRLEEIFCQFCHQGVESEEHDVYHCTGFYETRGTYQCLFKQGFGPLHRVMEYKDQHCLEHFLLELNETWRKVVGQQYSHTSSSTKNNHNFLSSHLSYLCYKSIEG